MTMDEKTLRERYARLMERRAQGAAIHLETLEALAEDRLSGAERVAALDAVLADPEASKELAFLREVALARPRPSPRRTYWLAAAAVMVAVGAGLVWKASAPGRTDPLRGPESGVALVLPASGASLAPGDTLVWHPVQGALSYGVEVVTSDGELAFRVETADTTAVVAPPAGAAWPVGAGQWSVTSNVGGNAGLRSTPRPVVLAPPR